jgi:hypothetical protein
VHDSQLIVVVHLMLFSSYNYDEELEVISYLPVMIIMQECIS